MRVEAPQHGRLQRVAPDVQAVIARSLVARRCAAEQVLRNHRVPAAAASALHEAGEEVSGPAAIIKLVLARRGRLVGQRLLTRLDRIPHFLINNAQLGDFLDHPFGFGVQPRNAPSGIWVFEIAEAIPDETADIELVVEDANAALWIAVNGRWPPFSALRSRHTFAVQLECDCA
ncbi:hypothetical protein XI03_25180 [Bradyrhizobium sp. CCBAU 65884]|nr:hypothetical protein [Bradyrhizobium sp. CCBAU 65884]